HYASASFWERFSSLPASVQQLARQNYALLRDNPAHPSLHFKKVRQGQYRSARVGSKYRALGVPVPDGVQWFWIGTHAEYDKLMR
ncbi:MAG: hypothetical protein WBM40_13585, partial [Thiohalocapsa sp.]